MSTKLQAGQIIRPHGIRGDVKIESWCDAPEVMLPIETFYLKDGTALIPAKIYIHKNNVHIRFTGKENIEAAEALRGQILYVERDAIDIDEDAFFVEDLIGVTVSDADTGETYGTLADVIATGANDVYIIRGNKREFLVPVIEDVIIETDLDAKTMKIRPLPGLFE